MRRTTVDVVEHKTSENAWVARFNPDTGKWEEFTWNPDTEPGPPPIPSAGPMWLLEQMPTHD